MTDAHSRRLAAAIGLALSAALALWWLGSSRIALDRGSDAARSAALALDAAWLVRALALALLSVRIGALHGWRAGGATALVFVVPSWPVVLLAWLASTAALASVFVGELVLVLASLALPLVGERLQRALPLASATELTANMIGVALAAALLAARGPWPAQV